MKFYVYISGAYKGCLFFYSAKNRQMAQQLTLDIPGYKTKRDDSWTNKKEPEMIPIYTNITLNVS